jgi:hypothetical protein
VRVLLGRLLCVLVRSGGRALSAYGAELLTTTCALLADPYHDVNLQGCGVLLALNGGYIYRVM